MKSPKLESEALEEPQLQTTPANHTGRLIRSARLGRSFTQIDLASKLHVHAQLISNVERGVTPLPPNRGRAICKALKLTHDQLRGAMLSDYEEELQKVI